MPIYRVYLLSLGVIMYRWGEEGLGLVDWGTAPSWCLVYLCFAPHSQVDPGFNRFTNWPYLCAMHRNGTNIFLALKERFNKYCLNGYLRKKD